MGYKPPLMRQAHPAGRILVIGQDGAQTAANSHCAYDFGAAEHPAAQHVHHPIEWQPIERRFKWFDR